MTKPKTPKKKATKKKGKPALVPPPKSSKEKPGTVPDMPNPPPPPPRLDDLKPPGQIRISLSVEQSTIMDMMDRQKAEAGVAYAKRAMLLGDFRDQIQIAEADEKAARDLLKKAENEYTAARQEIATALGHQPGEKWSYHAPDHCFEILKKVLQ